MVTASVSPAPGRHTPPAAALTAPGFCHRHEITGFPSAGEVTLDNGIPVGHVIIGRIKGAVDPVVLDISTLAEMDELVHAVQLLHSRMAMWYQDHRAHPFGDEAA